MAATPPPSEQADREDPADERAFLAEKREFVADERQRLADVREAAADVREALADERQQGPSSAADRRRGDEARTDRDDAQLARAAADRAREQAGLPRPLARELTEVTRALSHQGTLEESFQHVVTIAQRIARHCDAVSYTQKLGDGYSTLASTSDDATGVDEVQYRAGEGPSIDATEQGEPITSADVGSDPRWPTFTAQLAATVARSVMSTPVTDDQLDQVVFGSLNHYGPGGTVADSDDIESAMLLSAHLAALLSLRAAHDAEAVQLREAIVTRDIIGQAKGILMARQGVEADEAFDIMRRASQRLNRKLRDLASDMASGSLETSEPEGGHA